MKENKQIIQLSDKVLVAEIIETNNTMLFEVLYDRYVFDTIVSLNGASKKSSLEKIMLLFLNLFPKPNFIIFLSIDPIIAYERTGEFGVEVLRRKQKELRQVLSLESDVHEFEVTDGSESALNLIRELGEEENLT